jgi:hypothetical protein
MFNNDGDLTTIDVNDKYHDFLEEAQVQLKDGPLEVQ